MRFYDLLCNEIDRIKCNKWKLKSLVLKIDKDAVTRIRTGVIAATTQGPNH